jgi:peptidoglycan hydrolase FlgJ
MGNPINKLGSYCASPQIRNNHRAVQSNPEPEALRKACHDFESLFVKYMLQTMRDTIPENNLFGGGQAEKIYTGMLDDAVARSVSEQRGIGLAAIMYAQMSAMGEKDNSGK